MIGAPIFTFFRRFSGKNTAAVGTLGIFILLAFLLGYIFVPSLLTQARNLASADYNQVIENLEEPINDWENWLIDRGLITPAVAITVDEEGVIDRADEKDKSQLITKVISLDSLRMSKGDTVSNGEKLTLLIQLNHHEWHEENEAPASSSLNDTDSFFELAKKNLYSFLNPSLIPRIFSGLIGTLGTFLVGFFSVLFIAFFFIREQGLFDKMISAAVPNEYEEKTHNAIQQSSSLLIRYFVGILTQVTIITVLVSILLSLFGVKNALLIGFFAALMNVIPYIGPIVGATFAVIITVSSNLDMSFYSDLLPILLKVLGVFAFMQLIDNFILQPNIFSKSVKAHPLEIFIVVLIGAKLGGVAGMVLAIPIYTVLRVVAKVFLSEFKVVQQITKNL